MNRTYTAKPSTIEQEWFVVDATGYPVGRLAAEVAKVLRGKHKPTFTYNMDCGDFVIVINADKAVWTGRKEDELVYWHTGWPGGIRNISRGDMKATKPDMMIEKAVWGMLPKGKLGHQIFKKLKVYAGSEHPHGGQNPTLLDISKK